MDGGGDTSAARERSTRIWFSPPELAALDQLFEAARAGRPATVPAEIVERLQRKVRTPLATERLLALFEAHPEARALNQTELAVRLGMRRETVCRTLGEMALAKRRAARAATAASKGTGA